MACQLCGRKAPQGGRLRYVTRRVRVCQQCVTIIHGATAPYQIARAIEADLVRRHFQIIDAMATDIECRKAQYLPIEPFIFDRAGTQVEAKRMLRRSNGVIGWTVERIFRADKLRRAIEATAQRLEEEAQRRWIEECKLHELHNSRLREKIAADNYHVLSARTQVSSLLTQHLSQLSIHNKPTGKDGRVLMALKLGLVVDAPCPITRVYDADYLALRRAVIAQDLNRCTICSRSGQDYELHVHHIIRLALFGSNMPANLVTLCHRCHQRVHSSEGIKVSRLQPIKRSRK